MSGENSEQQQNCNDSENLLSEHEHSMDTANNDDETACSEYIVQEITVIRDVSTALAVDGSDTVNERILVIDKDGHLNKFIDRYTQPLDETTLQKIKSDECISLDDAANISFDTIKSNESSDDVLSKEDGKENANYQQSEQKSEDIEHGQIINDGTMKSGIEVKEKSQDSTQTLIKSYESVANLSTVKDTSETTEMYKSDTEESSDDLPFIRGLELLTGGSSPDISISELEIAIEMVEHKITDESVIKQSTFEEKLSSEMDVEVTSNEPLLSEVETPKTEDAAVPSEAKTESDVMSPEVTTKADETKTQRSSDDLLSASTMNAEARESSTTEPDIAVEIVEVTAVDESDIHISTYEEISDEMQTMTPIKTAVKVTTKEPLLSEAETSDDAVVLSTAETESDALSPADPIEIDQAKTKERSEDSLEVVTKTDAMETLAENEPLDISTKPEPLAEAAIEKVGEETKEKITTPTQVTPKEPLQSEAETPKTEDAFVPSEAKTESDVMSSEVTTEAEKTKTEDLPAEAVTKNNEMDSPIEGVQTPDISTKSETESDALSPADTTGADEQASEDSPIEDATKMDAVELPTENEPLDISTKPSPPEIATEKVGEKSDNVTTPIEAETPKAEANVVLSENEPIDLTTIELLPEIGVLTNETNAEDDIEEGTNETTTAPSTKRDSSKFVEGTKDVTSDSTATTVVDTTTTERSAQIESASIIETDVDKLKIEEKPTIELTKASTQEDKSKDEKTESTVNISTGGPNAEHPSIEQESSKKIAPEAVKEDSDNDDIQTIVYSIMSGIDKLFAKKF